jgi:hypothetical protein
MIQQQEAEVLKRYQPLPPQLIAVPPSFASDTDVPFSTVAFQNDGFVSVPLGPGLDPLLNPVFPFPPFTLVFDSTIPIGITTTLTAEFTLAGQQFTLGPVTNLCPPSSGGCGETYGFNVPVSHKVLNGTLKVTENGISQTDDFRFESFTPEPPTAVLMGIGFLIMFWRMKLWRSWQ